MQVIVDGLLVNYVSEGQGPVMLCVHGWGSNTEAFRGFIKHFPNYQVVAVDLPGFGGSEPPKEPWGLQEYARFVRNFCDKLKLSPPNVIVSHSNGTAIAIKGLASGRLTAKKFIILGGAGVRYVQKGKKTFLKTLSSVGKPVLLALPAPTREKVRKKWYGAIGSEMLEIPGMEDTFKKVVGEDVVPLARDVGIPTLLIYGENDESTPPLYGQIFFENFPDAQLEIVGSAGHYVQIDQESRVMELIKEFL